MLSHAPIRAYIPASDVQRARKFYEEVLGLEPGEEYAGGGIYECGDTEARGVTFEEYDFPGMTMKNSIVTAGGAKAAWFKDSEGNIMAVTERL